MVRTRQSSFVEEGISPDLIRLESRRSTKRSNYVEDDDSEESGYLPIRRSFRRITSIKDYRKLTKDGSKENVNPSPGPSHRTRNATRKESQVLFHEDVDDEADDADGEEGEVGDGEEVDDDDDDEDDDDEEGKIMNRDGASNGVNGIRRSTRQRKSLYDTLNQSWILGTKIRDFPNLERAMLEESHKMSRKRGRNDNMPEESYDDMYTRIKRQRRKAVRSLYLDRNKKGLDETDDSAEEGDTEEDADEGMSQERMSATGWESKSSGEDTQDEGSPHPKYDLRRNKPIINRFQVPIEPTRSRKTVKSIGHLSPTHRRERFSSFKSPAHKSNNVQRRRHATHNSSSSSGSSTSSSSEDERRFERRKAKSMARARNRCLPMNFTANDMNRNVLSDRLKSGSSLADIDPMEIDRSVTFDSIGGLNKHLQSLKEMILFPLMYTEVFEKFKITPPRGVLFYGPPGTGKTLVARALANECSQGDHKVAFFMRKGADCLSKWVGESERQLRLLFDQAYCMRPSIIFFDEIDGLAPVRSSRQDQIHSSIVSTLLALMDGLDSRGEVVVIGATNRIDAIDPALRRPGRFDREFNFSLPSVSARRSILKIHTKNWEPPLAEQFINRIAERTAGYCGADLKALCAEVALIALKRRYPQIYSSRQKLQLDVSQIQIKACDFSKAVAHLAPASQRSSAPAGRPLSVLVHPLLHNSLNRIWETMKEIFPKGMAKSSLMVGGSASQVGSDSESEYDEDDDDTVIFASDLESAGPSTSSKTVNCLPRSALKTCKPPRRVQTHVTSHRSRLLIVGQPDQGQSTHLAPAVLHGLEHLPTHKLDLPTLYAVTAKAPEESCAQVFNEARRILPSVLYLPHVSQWWETLSDTVRATFLTLLHDLEPGAPLLILATSDCRYEDLPEEVSQLFSVAQGEVVEMTNPTKAERREFFSELLQLVKQPPKIKQKPGDAEETLPVAPPPEPRKLNEVELQRLEDQEESTLRELRLFLREILYKLARDRRFSIFSKPVDITEVPDYLDVVKVPMDLETMVAKVDTHRYETVAQFLDDVDLICHNALEYNPDRDPSDKAIRHRACALRDAAHAFIDAELDPEFEKICHEIAESRKRRGFVPSKFAPKNYHTLPRCLTDGLDDSSGDPNSATRFSRRLRGMDVPLGLPPAELDATSVDAKKNPRSPHINPKNMVSQVIVRRRRGLWFGSCRKRIIRKMVPDTPETSDKSFSPRNEREMDAVDRLDNGHIDEREVTLSVEVGSALRHVDTHSSEKGAPSSIDSGNESRRCPSTPNLTHDPKERTSATLLLNGEVSSDTRLSCTESSTGRDDHDLRSRDHCSKDKPVSEDKRPTECSGGNVSNCRLPLTRDCCRSPPRSPTGLDHQKKATSRSPVKAELPKVVEVVVDENRLQRIHDDLVGATENSSVETLGSLHCRLYRCIVAHQKEANKTSLLKSMEDCLVKFRRTPKS